ncbi:MAG: hypothetical protein HY235_21215 [Acidobacteria bacterium]|nr:hypothetical protein [Acidobacteriota bacterium]
MTGGVAFKRSADRCGIVEWVLPPDSGRLYITLGDPGQGNAPYRNAPVVMTYDVTDFPATPAAMRRFWWGFGDGKYDPFYRQFSEQMILYNCAGCFDATGAQKAFGEGKDIAVPEHLPVIPIDLSGNFKMYYMIILKKLMGKGLILWPDEIKGIRHQFKIYRLPDRKIAQDIVSAHVLLAAYITQWLRVDLDGTPEEDVAGIVLDRRQRAGEDRHAREMGRGAEEVAG